MLSYTQTTLQKLEELLRIKNYKIRYEKGNFKSGTCTLLQDKILVVNKFSDLEVKINSIAELTASLDFSVVVLNEKQKKFLYLIKQTKLDL
ncbi:hypothetical protein [Albibacterium profundi]|uniref:Uncharacterized protein n=1 Tax=Albibacterium profundi TaxID=3134906 RepID=A0ABV5CCP3_9SPHI